MMNFGIKMGRNFGMRQNKMKKVILSAVIMLILQLCSPVVVSAEVTVQNGDAYDRHEEQIEDTDTYEEKKITLKAHKEVDPSKEPEKVDYEILIDGSGSMRDTDSLDETKKAIASFINERNPKYERIGATVFRGPGYDTGKEEVVYGIKTDVLSDFTDDYEQVIKSVEDMTAGGLTPLYYGLEKSLEKFAHDDRKEARKVLILFTDGHPNVGPKRDFFVDGEKIYDYTSELYNPEEGDYINEDVRLILNKTQSELDALDGNDLDLDFDNLDKIDELRDILEYYKPAYRYKLKSVNKGLEGQRYENNIHEFFDLSQLIKAKSVELKNEGVEVFTIYLDNSKHDSNTKMVNKYGDVERLFETISSGRDHFLQADKVSMLTDSFTKISESVGKYTYYIEDQIEAGYTLMPETIKVESPVESNVAIKHDDEKISWTSTGVDYNDLEVSYHINRVKPKTGQLIVKHVTVDGEELIEPIKTTKEIGTNYRTNQEEFEGYEFLKQLDGSAPTSGTYKEDMTTVTYVYKKKDIVFGELVVKHMTDNGEELKSASKTFEKIGTSYTTNKEEFEGYEFVKMLDDSASTSGVYKEDVTTVTYVYEKKEIVPVEQYGELVVKHIDKAGKELKPETRKTQKVMTSYETSQATIEGYTFSHMLDTSAAISGNYSEGITTVVYVYEPNAETPVEATKYGHLVVRHIKEDGTELKTQSITTEKIGDQYNTNKEEFVGYEFSRVVTDGGNTEGNYIEGTITVTYIYKELEEPNKELFGTLKVVHMTEDGELLKPVSHEVNKIGTPYQTSNEDFEDYDFVGLDMKSSLENGQYTEGETAVIYLYKKKIEAPKLGTLVVKHVNEDGKELTKPVTTTNKIGTPYTTNKKEIQGYEFLKLSEKSATAMGEYDQGLIEVVYVYTALPKEVKKGTVIVKYVTEDGKELEKPVELVGNVGTLYQTEKKEISGYEFVGLSENGAKSTGNYDDTLQTVIYVYKTKALVSTKNTHEGTVTPQAIKASKASNDVSKSSKQLPKTGEVASHQVMLIGELMLALLGILWYFKKQKSTR